MKYFLFSCALVGITGVFATLFSPYSDAFAEGVGLGLGALLVGCLGLLHGRDRFLGFAIVSSIVAIPMAISWLQSIA